LVAIYAEGLKELKQARSLKWALFMRFSCILLKRQKRLGEYPTLSAILQSAPSRSRNAFNISFAVQNPKDIDGVFIKKIINPNGFKPRNRPRAQILKLWIARSIARAYKGMQA
jgi:hypothetical protein